MTAPQLRTQDIEAKLDKLFKEGEARNRSLFAFFGTGDPARLSHKLAGTVEVVPVRSELDLREQLPPLGSSQVTVFLVPWMGRLPLDIGGRFHRSGAIQPIGQQERIARLFGVTEVDDDVRGSPLVRHLLAGGPARSFAYSEGRLTVDGLWTSWLGQVWGIPVEGGLALDALIGFAALDGHGERMATELSGAEDVRGALLAYVEKRLGAVGPLAFEAWLTGRGRALLEIGLVLATVATAEHAGARVWTKQAMKQAFGLDDAGLQLATARALGEAAPRALRFVAGRSDAQTIRAILESADARLDDAEVRLLLEADPRLPSGWSLRLARVGALLLEATTAPSAAMVRRLAEAFRVADAHEMARQEDKHRDLRRAEMACRLAAWLCAVPEGWPEAGPTAHADVETLAPWYAAEGGFVDWARRRARGTAEDELGRGIMAVVAAVDARREALDRRFARALARWHEATQPAHHVVPIHDAVRRIAVRFLKEHEERRLLVLLLDGMAWAQAVEILSDLGTRPVIWGPIAWHSGAGRIGESRYPAVLAAVPTMTNVSRSAFFAGKAMSAKVKHAEEKDVDRWAENTDLRPYTAEGQGPRLLLRAESHTGDGSVSSAALQLVGDMRQRIVAIVINAIDASLKGDTQQRHSWKTDSIASLPDLLEKARETGRTVLFCSDHGHVPADRMKTRTAPAKGGARWRPLATADETLAPFEVAFSGKGVWLPPGSGEALALIADDTARYVGGSAAGDHGGATLAEVVAPCMLIGCEDVLVDDPGRAVHAFSAPPWWHLDVIEAPVAAAVEAPRKVISKKVNEAQLTLPQVAEPPAPVVVPLPELALATSPLFEQRAGRARIPRQTVLNAVRYLIERHGIAPADAFASAMSQPSNRVEGFVAGLGEVLNVDAYAVVFFEYSSRQVRLDRDKLEALFEVKL